MKYKNDFNKVKITIEQLMSIFDCPVIDVVVRESKRNKIVCRTTKNNIPVDVTNKYVDSFSVLYDCRESAFSTKIKTELVIYIPEYSERVII